MNYDAFMHNSPQTYETIGKGVGLISHAITVFVIAILVAVGSMVSVFASPAIAMVGFMGVWGLLIIAGILSIVGKYFCTASPVGGGVIKASLALDLLAIALSFTNSGKNISGYLNMISLACFMYFLYILGGHLHSHQLIDDVVVTVKRYFGGLGLMFAGVVGMIFPPVGMVLIAVALFLVLSAFFKYLGCLTTAQAELLSAARGDSRPVNGSSSQF